MVVCLVGTVVKRPVRLLRPQSGGAKPVLRRTETDDGRPPPKIYNPSMSWAAKLTAKLY